MEDVTDGLKLVLTPGGPVSPYEKALNLMVASAKEMLIQNIRYVSIKCRRDDLWLRLTTMDPRAFTSNELGELLSLVQIQKLDTLNSCLKSISTRPSTTNFLDTLVSNVRKAFPNCHRVFVDPSTGRVQQVLIKTGSVFLMVVVDWRMMVTTTSLVSKDAVDPDTASERTSQVAQDFVNRCAFQYWRRLF